MNGLGKERLDDMDPKGSKDEEDGLQIGQLEQIPGQAGKLVHNLRVVHQKVPQGLKEVEDNCSSPAEATKPLVLVCKHHCFCVLAFQKKTKLLVVPLFVRILWGNQLEQDIKRKAGNTAVLTADVQ